MVDHAGNVIFPPECVFRNEKMTFNGQKMTFEGGKLTLVGKRRWWPSNGTSLGEGAKANRLQSMVKENGLMVESRMMRRGRRTPVGIQGEGAVGVDDGGKENRRRHRINSDYCLPNKEMSI
jgi:hypothetical protein